MKTYISKTGKTIEHKTSRLLIAGYMMISLTAGWFMGSLSSIAFSQTEYPTRSNETNRIVPEMSYKGETMPTIILNECSVTADKMHKLK